MTPSSPQPLPEDPEKVLAYWFDGVVEPAERKHKMNSLEYFDSMASRWFMARDAAFSEVQKQSVELVHKAGRNKLRGAEWQTPRGLFAQLLLTDQFPRSIWRGAREAYQYDPRALELSRAIVANGWDKSQLYYAERVFAYLPMEHSEDLAAQREGLRLMKRAASDAPWRVWWDNWRGVSVRMAKQHVRIIERFGRFPYRNDVLGRQSSREELEWLGSPELPLFAKSQLSQATDKHVNEAVQAHLAKMQREAERHSVLQRRAALAAVGVGVATAVWMRYGERIMHAIKHSAGGGGGGSAS